MGNTPAELELAEARVAASTASIVAQGQALKLKVRRLVTSPFVIGGLITAAAAVGYFAVRRSAKPSARSSRPAAHGNLMSMLKTAQMLVPLLGRNASNIFAVALLFAGVASSITSGMAGGSIFAGLFSEPFDLKDNHSRMGVFISLVLAVVIIFMISNPSKGLIISQMILSVQLPFTIFIQIYLTSSRKVMGKYANSKWLNFVLLLVGIAVTYLNIRLLTSLF